MLARGLLFGQLLGWGLDAAIAVAFSFFVAAGAALRISVLIRRPIRGRQ
ncbi:hypothetical protein [Jiangella alkaliphila]|uniref:Uncharacterized protein n=1 Tax=Jiangella alkaliphila TaxID=419479 RepID=A0A1H2L8D9_9ACTN|nr:hypothetical protein [Jiangella alkaliphila]SDU77062.1 hypothetical protein SAMN04488563_5407 [Jiangella alkaliphila]